MKRGILGVSLCLLGCASWLPAPVPMRAIDHERDGTRAACLLVFLPGRGDDAEGFARNGFVREVSWRGYSVDMVAADATLGYYTRGVFSERLADDVVRRRVARGYKELWLVGNSMGGLGSFLYARQRPIGEVTGVLALAPFLGANPELFRSIHRAGGLARWRAPAKTEQLDESNFDRELWRWLQAVTARREPGPELYLGYGSEDRLSEQDAIFAKQLPRERVWVEKGGRHNWATWRKLFSRFLDEGPLRERCR